MSQRPDLTLIQVPERLEGQRTLLLPARPGDGLALNQAVCESLDQLRPWMPWAQTAPTPEQSEGVVRRMHGEFVLREDLAYLMWARQPDGSPGRPGRLLGGCGLHRMDWLLRRFEIGYWIRSSAQGQGHVAEAVQLLSQMAFTQLRARRLEIRCDARNVRSRAVAERAGFALEGILRQSMLDVEAAPADQCVYAKLPI